MEPRFFCNFAAVNRKTVEMKRLFRYVTLIVVLAFLVNVVYGQTQKWREIHKVKKKETIFGIAREYGLTIQELIDANPEMNTPGYELKKDAYIYIPYAKGQEPQPSAPVQRPAPTFTQQQSQQDSRTQEDGRLNRRGADGSEYNIEQGHDDKRGYQSVEHA